ncbi:membrane dipeptidase [Siminovitchia sp. 179-K 8D1 HS]|uniref:membrane dipeptidase n=1 Tax=Siminovitchia sp. 179-K 8D1 HS TaxID=3142385 RepID=UPI0039A36D6D
MNRLGMVINVSHMAKSTFWDVIEVSKAPIIASHSGVKALKDYRQSLGRSVKRL